MAAAPKKKKTSQPAKKNTRTPPPPAPTYGREIVGGVCLLLALCAVVSYFQEEALFITFFGGLLKGLLGYGYWLSAPALLLTGLLLLTHRDRPATLRSVCTLLVPVLTGCGLHLLLCARSYEPGLTGLRELWLSGRSLQSGGALSGGLAVGFSAVFGKVLSLILFLLMLLAALCLALHFSPKDAVRRAQERREAEREDIPEEAPPVREKEKPAEKRPRRRAAIDIPLDDEPPVKQPQPRPEEPAFAPKEKKPFFSRKSSTVRTPDGLGTVLEVNPVSGYLRVRCGTEALTPRYYKVGVCEYISGGKRAPRRPDPDDDYSGVRNPAPVVASADADGSTGCGNCPKKGR